MNSEKWMHNRSGDLRPNKSRKIGEVVSRFVQQRQDLRSVPLHYPTYWKFKKQTNAKIHVE